MKFPDPAKELILSGEAGLAIYGLLFVICVLAFLVWRLTATLNGRDKLIAEMVDKLGSVSDKQAESNLRMAVALSRIESRLGLQGGSDGMA